MQKWKVLWPRWNLPFFFSCLQFLAASDIVIGKKLVSVKRSGSGPLLQSRGNILYYTLRIRVLEQLAFRKFCWIKE